LLGLRNAIKAKFPEFPKRVSITITKSYGGEDHHTPPKAKLLSLEKE